MRAALVLFFCIAASCGSRPCSAETTACGCFSRSGSSLVGGGASECRLVTDSCWCPSECDTNVRCVCGGGRFVRCEALTDAGN